MRRVSLPKPITVSVMRWVVTLSLVLTVACAAQSHTVTQRPSVMVTLWKISGNVTSHQKLKPSDDATVMVGLLDISHDFYAPSSTVAVQVIKHVKRFPVPYTLQIDPSRIESGHRYALRAIVGGNSSIHLVSLSRTVPRPQMHGGKFVIEVIPVDVWYRKVHSRSP